MPNLTLSMIVKNEAKYLRECLESVCGVVDEIVIVDTGSTDSTLEIAKEFDAKIFHFDWISNFSAARNYALSKSTGEWILYLDADEILSEKSKVKVRRIIKQNKSIGVKCIVKSFNDQGKVSQSMKYTRLFKNSSALEFCGKAHEQIEPSLIKNKYSIVDSNIEILHYGYSGSKEMLKKKADRNLKLLLKDYHVSPNAYTAFQIANSYFVLEDIEMSVKFFKDSLNYGKLANVLKAISYMHIADFEMRNNNLGTAKKFADKGLWIVKNNLSLNMIAAQIYNKLNDYSKAINLIKNTYNQNLTDSTNEVAINVDSEKILLEGILASTKKRDEKNRTFFTNELIRINREFGLFVSELIEGKNSSKFYDRLNKFIDEKNLETMINFISLSHNNEMKLDIYSKLFERFNNNSTYLSSFGSFLISIKQLEEAKIMLEQALQLPDYPDSTIFYLASAYVTTNDIERLNEVMDIADERAKQKPHLFSKLNLLKQKLQPLLS